MAENKSAGMFSADLQALNLPAEAHERVANAIQKAVIAELATLDLAPRLSIGFLGPHGFGRTDGIYVSPLEVE